MSRDGRIGDRELLKRLADALQMEGVNRMPAALNRDQVQVVVDLGRYLDPQPLYGTQTYWHHIETADVSGTPSYDAEILAADATLHQKVLSLYMEVEGDADAAFRTGQVRVYFRLPIGQPHYVIDLSNGFKTDSGGQWRTRFALSGLSTPSIANTGNLAAMNWDGYVPPEAPLRITVESEYGIANFPANSSVSWGIFAVQWPVGTQRPF